MYKQSLLQPSTLSRFFIAFILLLLLMLVLFVYNYSHAWLISKQSSLNSMSLRLAYQIEDYRYHANHLYKLANPETKNTEALYNLENNNSVIKIRPNVYWLSSTNQTIDAIIFGDQEKEDSLLASILANYMEIVWGARNEYNSMYYLDGSNNSLILITTHSVLKPELRYKESYLTLSAEEKRADMLVQSTILDKRETLSNIQKLSPENIYYYTYRAMFNSPGQLTSIISFDISLNSISALSLSSKNISLVPANLDDDFDNNKNNISIQGAQIIFSQPVQGTSYKLIYELSLKDSLINILSNNFWLIICMILFTTLACGGSLYIRRRFITPNRTMYRELQAKDSINNEIVNNIPYGLMVYDFSLNRKVLSNSIANKLLTSMDLVHIRDMAVQNHGIIQVSIENIVYEITLVNSSMFDNTFLFILVDKDNEALSQKKHMLAEREYQKNIHLRKIIFENMGFEIQPTLTEIDQQIKNLLSCEPYDDNPYLSQLILNIDSIKHWFDNINLLTQVEAKLYTQNIEPTAVSTIITQFLQQKLLLINQKGLTLYFHNHINPEQLFSIDKQTLLHVIELTINYSIGSTSFGKISLTLDHNAERNEIIINIMDSGYGLTAADLSNLQFPFSNRVIYEQRFSRSGVTFYLCHILCKMMNGSFTINSKEEIGSHYTLTFAANAESTSVEFPPLLEDITILVDIHNHETETIVKDILSHYGASVKIMSKQPTNIIGDIVITDNEEEYEIERATIILDSSSTQLTVISATKVKSNFNFSDQIINAISFLIDNSESSDHIDLDNLGINEFAPEMNEYDEMDVNQTENILASYKNNLSISPYRDLFITTVPVDINKLYSSESIDDLTELKDITHRLKGVFAMLDFDLLKKMCEYLEHHIAEHNKFEISKGIRELEYSVSKLMPEGDQ